jgi:site-specific recombinase XerD
MGAAESTRRNYATPIRNYIRFCNERKFFDIVPTTEPLLCLWVSKLATTIHHTSIKAYLYGVRSLHIDCGHSDPLAHTPMLDRVFRGIKRAQGTRERKERLALTLPMLQAIQRHLAQIEQGKLTWAVCCMGVAGLFRIGELSPCSAKETRLLRVSDLQMVKDSQGTVSCITVHLRESKTDPFRQEVDVHITSRTAITAFIRYFAHHPDPKNPQAPLFALHDKTPYLRESLIQHVQSALTSAGIDAQGYSGFSFRKGGATSLARMGVSDRIIQALGRWKSWCYQLYIQEDREALLRTASQLSL